MMTAFSMVLFSLVVGTIGLLCIYCRWVAHVEAKRYALYYAESDRTFDERFPPISDAEFMSRCAPGTRPEIALKVRRIVSDCLSVEYERIYPESRLHQDLGADR